MVNNLGTMLQAFSFLNGTPVEQQATAVTALFRMAASQYLNMNDEQVDLIIGAFNNPEILDTNGVPNESVIKEIFQQFNEAASEAAPLRIVCKQCGTMNKVVLNG